MAPTDVAVMDGQPHGRITLGRLLRLAGGGVAATAGDDTAIEYRMHAVSNGARGSTDE